MAVPATATITPRPEGPLDAPPNHADNHAYRKTVELKGEDVCRASVHSERVRLVLSGFGSSRSVEETAVRDALAQGGYPGSSVQVRPAGQGALLAGISVQGFCVEASVGPTTVTTEGHGVYVEGGCLEPQGGH